MKVLLRSCFIVSPSDRAEDAVQNVWHLMDFLAPSKKDPGLWFDVVEDIPIWNRVREHVLKHHHCPDTLAIRHHFEMLGETEVVSRLVHLSAIQPQYRGDFLVRAQNLIEERKIRLVGEQINIAAEILVRGAEVGIGPEKTTLRGSQAAISYLMSQGSRLERPPTLGGYDRGITGASRALSDAYLNCQGDAARSLRCGLDGIDGREDGQDSLPGIQGIGGIRPGELWVHAGFTGGGKSSFGLNWAYNASVGASSLAISLGFPPARRRVLYYSLEMGLVAPHWMLVSLFSSSWHWRNRRIELGLPDSLYGGLPYSALVDGSLDQWHPKGKRFLDDVLGGLDQLGSSGTGNVIIREPHPVKGNPTVQQIWMEAERLAVEFGRLDMIIVDHAGLIRPPRGAGTESWNRTEAVYQELHRMALGFNGGRGIPVLALHQVNREGGQRALTRAEKSKIPRYDLTHLAGGAEAERSADVVTTSYVDDRCREKGRILFDCLKSRLRAPFQPYLAAIDWPTRRIRDLERMGQPAEDPGAFFGSAPPRQERDMDSIRTLDV